MNFNLIFFFIEVTFAPWDIANDPTGLTTKALAAGTFEDGSVMKILINVVNYHISYRLHIRELEIIQFAVSYILFHLNLTF